MKIRSNRGDGSNVPFGLTTYMPIFNRTLGSI